jgi:Spy/CpxP family protein refolding chaperone
MKENLLKAALVVLVTAMIIGGIVAAAVAGFAAGQTQGAATASRGHSSCDEATLELLPSALNITVTQIDNLRRITDRAKPQLAAVRKDARGKKQAIMDATMSEINVFLTPTQQQKLEELQKARQAEHLAKAKIREVLKPSSLFESQ